MGEKTRGQENMLSWFKLWLPPEVIVLHPLLASSLIEAPLVF